jgi:hypothetical protein
VLKRQSAGADILQPSVSDGVMAEGNKSVAARYTAKMFSSFISHGYISETHCLVLFDWGPRNYSASAFAGMTEKKPRLREHHLRKYIAYSFIIFWNF